MEIKIDFSNKRDNNQHLTILNPVNRNCNQNQ